MAVYTQLSNEQIAQLVNETYALGPLSFAVGIAEGVENTNYLCVTRDHDGAERKSILTLYEKRVRSDELPFFLDLLQHLAQKNIACPQPLMRRDGALHGMVAGKQAAMVSFLPGKSITKAQPVHLASLGVAVAKLHQAAADFSGQRVNAMNLAGWQNLYRAMAGQLNQLHDGLENIVNQELQFLAANWPASLPSGIIHADIFPDNVFFEDADLSGIIDFYFACEDAYAYELAIIINAWCFDGRQFSAAKASNLLRSYAQIRPLNAAEINALPVLCRGAALRFLLTRAYDKLHAVPGALVQVKDPLEYLHKLQFMQRAAPLIGQLLE